jgi:hypothetical protein
MDWDAGCSIILCNRVLLESLVRRFIVANTELNILLLQVSSFEVIFSDDEETRGYLENCQESASVVSFKFAYVTLP